MWRRFSLALLLTVVGAAHSWADEPSEPDYETDIAPVLATYCVGCHNAQDAESGLSLDSFASLQRGGDRGPAIIPGRADASLLIRVIDGELEPAMPPEGNERPTETNVAVLRAWIDSGARGPAGDESVFRKPTTPDIPPTHHLELPITALAVAPKGESLAMGRFRQVQHVRPDGVRIATFDDAAGKLNAVHFSADGELLIFASGIVGLYGESEIIRVADGTRLARIRGHRDIIYDAELSPDGKLIATCSYDREIKLWDAATAQEIKTLSGHNGAVHDVSFDPSGQVLASASNDGTVKLWNVRTGERLDTLSQPEGEQLAVEISPDSKWVYAAGRDRQIRKWRLVSHDEAAINPLAISRTAHEAPLVDLSLSPDGTKLVSASQDRGLTLWDAATLMPLHRYEEQSDVVSATAFAPQGDRFYVVRMDGTWGQYHVPMTSAKPPGASSQVSPSPAISSDEQPRVETTRERTDQEEHEPNDSPAVANPIEINSTVSGTIAGPKDGLPDSDLFRFSALQGECIVFEIDATRSGSPLDSKLEILDREGIEVPRVLLQAVRASYFTFRGHDSKAVTDFRLHRWEDMELNQFVYANGEVVKLWMYPRGPDSGFLVYPGMESDRYSYFGTTSVTHALNEPCYVVEAHPPGAELIENGLPQFMIHYENDDDGRRRLGTDSYLEFTAPADGEYFVRVSDVRSQGGDDFHYKLTAHGPQPRFKLALRAPDLEIPVGSAKEFSVKADRIDGFDGEIKIELTGLPPGFHATQPLSIEAGQTIAFGVIAADENAASPTDENKNRARLVASAMIHGEQFSHEPIELGELKLTDAPKVLIEVFPSKSAQGVEDRPACSDTPETLILQGGETIPVMVRVQRKGFDGEISFGIEFAGRNLPHGVYVDNIGLNGLTLLEGESQREFFITAAKWVPETERPFHLRAEIEGNPTSRPILLQIQNEKSK